MGSVIIAWSSFGYFPQCFQDLACCLEKHLKSAQLLFANTGVNITTYGRLHLGAAVGSPTYITWCVSGEVSTWVQELQLLSLFAVIQPTCSLLCLYSRANQ